ncbi:hypothetical protein HDU93_005135 [Gonapodya sp. JEL0774]|nr:hypothetical protein HDU93_005135 [Gonapodya sp. JEL0774]
MKTTYDVAFILLGGPGLPDNTFLSRSGTQLYAVYIGVPSRVLNEYPSVNKSIQSAAPMYPRPLPFNPSSSSTQILPSDSRYLEVSSSLIDYARRLSASGYAGPVSQINLLAFKEGGHAKQSYHKYGQGFVKEGGKHGGNAKIVGNVVAPEPGKTDSRTPGSKWWDEIAIAHYPSIWHFVDMSADPAYQQINQEFRLPPKSLRLADCGVKVVKTNLHDRSDVEKAFEGAWGVFAVTSFYSVFGQDLSMVRDPEVLGDLTFEERTGKTLADVAKEKGVKRYVWSSLDDANGISHGKYEVKHFTGKHKVEECIRSIGLPATFVYLGFYVC